MLGKYEKFAKLCHRFLQQRRKYWKKIPGPRINWTTHVSNGTEMYIELEWSQTDLTKKVFEMEESLFDIDADKLCEDEIQYTKSA